MSFVQNLNLIRVIAHQVYPKGTDGNEVKPFLSKSLITLSPAFKSIISSRIVAAIGSDSHCVEMEMVDTSPGNTSVLGKNLIHSDENFISYSHVLTKKLSSAQQVSRNIPGGLVLFFTGTVNNQNYKFWGVLKAEKLDGLNAKQNGDSIELELVDDLFLTPQTKMYKIGLFVEESYLDEDSGQQIEYERIFIFDQNMTTDESKAPAIYFHRTFLGARFAPTNKKLTRDFYSSAREFINSSNQIDPEDKPVFIDDLKSYLRGTQPTFHVRDFAEQYFEDLELVENFCSAMSSKGIPDISVAKDISYIKTKLKRRSLGFSNSIKIIGNADTFGDNVVVGEFVEGFTEIKIRGELLKNE